MTKKERVVAAINLAPLTQTPSQFSFHFPREQREGEACIAAHLDYFAQSDTDIVKIMNENLFTAPCRIGSVSDYYRMGKQTGGSSFIRKQLRLTTQILEQYRGDAFTCGTLHGITASAIHPLEASGMPYATARHTLCQMLREHTKETLSQLDYICDALRILARGYIQAGLDSVYYAALGGESQYFTDEEFELYIKPRDIQIMKTIRDEGGYCILHICKGPIRLARYACYADYADVINWGVHEVPCSLEEGRSIFKGTCILGGLANHDGVLENGTQEEIRRLVHNTIQSFGRRGYILGADCTLTATRSYDRIRSAVQAAREFF